MRLQIRQSNASIASSAHTKRVLRFIQLFLSSHRRKQIDALHASLMPIISAMKSFLHTPTLPPWSSASSPCSSDSTASACCPAIRSPASTPSLCPSNPTFPEGVIALHVTLSVCPENNYALSTSSSIYGLGLTIRNAPAPNTEIVSSGEQQIALWSMHRLDPLLWDGTSSTRVLRDLGSRSLSYKSRFSKRESSHSCPSWRSTLHCSWSSRSKRCPTAQSMDRELPCVLQARGRHRASRS